MRNFTAQHCLAATPDSSVKVSVGKFLKEGYWLGSMGLTCRLALNPSKFDGLQQATDKNFNCKRLD